MFVSWPLVPSMIIIFLWVYLCSKGVFHLVEPSQNLVIYLVIKGINSIFQKKNSNFYVKKKSTLTFVFLLDFSRCFFSYIEYSFFFCKILLIPFITYTIIIANTPFKLNYTVLWYKVQRKNIVFLRKLNNSSITDFFIYFLMGHPWIVPIYG